MSTKIEKAYYSGSIVCFELSLSVFEGLKLIDEPVHVISNNLTF